MKRRGAMFGVLLLVATAAQQSDVSGQSVSAKLTTVLADLAQAVAQDDSSTRTTRVDAAAVSIDRMPKSIQDAARGRSVRLSSNGEVQVYVLMTEVSGANIGQLAARGAIVEIADPAHRRVQARVPASRLQSIASLPFVNFVRLPTYAVRRSGGVLTEGDAIHRTDAVRRQLALDGTGIRVGVISDGIKGVFATGCTTCGSVAGGPIATGDLPAATGTRNARGVLTSSTGIAGRSFQANGDLEGLPPATPPCAFPGAGAEGTALLEIVHDLAPGASLAFANADTDLAFNQAVNFLASTNDVVVDDLGFYGEAYDGTSPVSRNTANALNAAANSIRAYVTSVGNAATEHYLGNYADSSVDGPSIAGITTPGHLHLFDRSGDTTDLLGIGAQPFNVISLGTNAEVVIFLSWDDRFGASANNYDLYLVQQSTGRVVARSTDLQNGGQDPLEAVDFTNTGAGDLFRIVVQNVRDQAQPKQLNIFSFGPQCAAAGPRPLVATRHERLNFNTAARSVSAQSDSGGSPVSVISVGAICSASATAASVFAFSSAPNQSCLDRTNSTIEFFSSLGPTIDGRIKPDVSAIDGVVVTAAGRFVNPFFGTSAAAPHVAGIAALALQAAPCLIAGSAGAADAAVARAALRELIVGSAVPLSPTVPDNTFGSGRADGFASVQKTLPIFRGTPTLTVSGNTPLGASLSAAQLGFSDPNRCALARLSWTGGCGTSPGSTLDCPFGTTRVSVAASNNGVAFSGAADIQIAVTNFAVAAAPGSVTVNAGQAAVYQVTVAPQGGAFPEGVTLGCANLPPGTTCSFNPPTVAPGATSGRSTLTIATTSRGQTASVNLQARTDLRLLLAARDATPSAFDRRCIPSGCVAPPSNIPDILGRRALPVGRIAALGATMALHHGLLCVVAVAMLAAPLIARASRRRLFARAALDAAALVAAVASIHVGCGGGNPPPPPPPPVSSPSAALSPSGLTFAAQTVRTTSAAQAVTLANGGTAALTISSIAASGDFAQTNTCGGSVGAGASCSINVTFTPSAIGQRTGSLTIADNAANSPHTVGLSGTGTAEVPGTPAGTYVIGLTGASGTLVQSSAVTLVVQ